jgi:hypothetical protein
LILVIGSDASVTTKDGLLRLLREQGGWLAPFLPGDVERALGAFVADPTNFGAAVALESVVNQLAVVPLIEAVKPRPPGPSFPAGQPLRDLAAPEMRGELLLTRVEAEAILQVVDSLGGSAGNVFSWGEQDSLDLDHVRAFFKVFELAGRPTPLKLRTEAAERGL